MNVKISPFSANGKICAAASKSYAHRFLIAAALCRGRTIIENVGSSDDVNRTIGCLSALGAKISVSEGAAEVFGIERAQTGAKLYVGESGSTLRFLMPVVAALGVSATFVLGKSLIERPIEGLIEVLTKHGAKIEKTSDGYFVNGKITAGEFDICGGVSSQYLSGLLFALPLLKGNSVLTTENSVSKSYVDMTLSVLSGFGILFDVKSENGKKLVYKSINGQNQTYITKGKYTVDGDFSSSAAFLTLGALTGKVTVMNLTPDMQGDKAIIGILKQAGARITSGENFVSAEKRELKPVKYDFTDCPDLVPVVVAFCVFAKGVSELSGVGRLKFKECDRLKACMEMCAAVAVKTKCDGDTLKIYGGKRKAETGKQIIFKTYGDHRMVMAAALIAAGRNGESIIENAEAVNKSCPEFSEQFKASGGNFNVII